MPVRHLLLDADGVVQTLPGGWAETAERFLGGESLEVLEQLFVKELPALRGESDFLADLRAAFDRRGIEADVDEFHGALWNAIEVSPDMVDLIHRLRASGYGVHLGTNQHRQRAVHMRGALGYDELFDVSCYSCDLGAVKPEKDFFDRAVDLIGATSAEVLFVDDSLGNVEGARAAGLPAEHWTIPDGMERLHHLLAAHGVRV